MKWNQSDLPKLICFLGLPWVCFGQAVSTGSTTQANPLNVYSPPCISQVKQYIDVKCQITPTGGAQPYSYTFTGEFPAGMSMSTGTGGGLINGAPTGTTGAQATVTVTDARGGTASTTFMIKPAGLTGTGPCGSAICVTATIYAIKTPDAYVVRTSAKMQMTATSYWSDGSSLDLPPIATWACTPSPACGSVSKNGLYTAGSSAATYHVTATFGGLTNDGGTGIAVTAAASQPSGKENNRVANSGVVMKEILQLKSGIPAAVLQKAECVVVIPSTLKFAVGV